MNRISVIFFLVDLCFYYLFIDEIVKLRIMCGIPLSTENMILLYNSFFLSNISYGIEIWGNTYK